MKKFFTLLFSTFCVAIATNAQSVSVNTDGSTADASAILDIKSATKGMLVPRVTTAQRNAIVTPANGLLVYDTDVKSFWYYNGSAWTIITGAGSGGSLSLPYDATVNTPGTAFKIANGTTAIEGSSINNAGVYGYSENGSGITGNSSNGFGVYATSTQATAIRANSSNTNPTIHSTNSNGTGTAIRGEASGVSGVGVFGTAASTTSYGVRGSNTVGTGVYGFSTSGHGVIASSNSGVGLRTSSTSGNALEVFGKLKIYGAAMNVQNGAVLTSDAEGNAKWKLNRVAFRASDVSGSLNDEQQTTAQFLVEEYDYSNSFNLQASTFAAPTTGVYNLGTRMTFQFPSLYFNINDVYCVFVINRGGNLITIYSPHGTIQNTQYESNAAVSFSTDIKLLAGDIVWVRGYQNNSEGESVFVWGGEFWGHLVFAE